MVQDQLSWADRTVLGFDLETTSSDPFEAQPVSFGLVRFDHQRLTGTVSGLVRPTVPIDPEAEAVHGISLQATRDLGEELGSAVSYIVETLVETGRAGVPLVGMHIGFDLLIVDTLAHSFLGAGLVEQGWRGPVIDVAIIDRHFDRWRSGKRRLSDLCTLYGVELDEAHDAAADATAAVRVAIAQASRFRFVRDAKPDVLTEAQVHWREQWFDDFSAYRAAHGQRPLQAHERRWPLMEHIHPELALERVTPLMGTARRTLLPSLPVPSTTAIGPHEASIGCALPVHSVPRTLDRQQQRAVLG